jgi:molybdenum cofactor biosynthesis enzyme MoaA
MHNIEVQNALYELRLSLTGRCNHNCIYCGPFSDGKSDNGYKDLSLDQIRQLAPFLKEKNLHIQLTGGEPTLRKDLGEIVQILVDSGITDIGITTNGSLFDKIYAETLSTYGITDFHFHVPSLNQEIFNRITKTKIKGIVDKIKDSASFLKQKGKRVELNTPVIPLNIPTLSELQDFCYENRINLKLIEEVNLGGDQVSERQIYNLLGRWFDKKGFKLREGTRAEQYGRIYDFGEFAFRIAPATKGLVDFLNHGTGTLLYDGRYWIGGREGKFMFSPTCFLNPEKGDFEDLKQDLNKTIQIYSNGKK